MGEIGNPPNKEVEKKEFKASKHYFKVDRKILDLSTNMLKKSELLVYLLHCRATNKGNNMGCSLAGATRAKKVFKLPLKSYEKALISLQEKHLLQSRPDVNTGKLRSVAIEVLHFPLYDKKTGILRLDEDRPDHHRRYRGYDYINIPSFLIDAGYFKSLSMQSIWGILWLYAYTNMIEYWGVDYDLVHAYNPSYGKGYTKKTVFGQGFHKSIYKKACVEVAECKKYKFSKELNNFQGIPGEGFNELIDRGIFQFKPIIIEHDEEDEDMEEVKGEVFNGLASFSDKKLNNKYLLVQPQNNQRIIWILRPWLPVSNEDFEFFINRFDKYYQIQKKIYADHDVRTDAKEKMKYIEDDYFLDWVMDNYDDLYDDLINLSESRNKKYTYNYKLDVIKTEIQKKQELIEAEQKEIKENNKINGTRKRTSDQLKQLYKELDNLIIEQSNYVNWGKDVENINFQIMDLIPNEVFKHYQNYLKKIEEDI